MKAKSSKKDYNYFAENLIVTAFMTQTSLTLTTWITALDVRWWVCIPKAAFIRIINLNQFFLNRASRKFLRLLFLCDSIYPYTELTDITAPSCLTRAESLLMSSDELKQVVAKFYWTKCVKRSDKLIEENEPILPAKIVGNESTTTANSVTPEKNC